MDFKGHVVQTHLKEVFKQSPFSLLSYLLNFFFPALGTEVVFCTCDLCLQDFYYSSLCIATRCIFTEVRILGLFSVLLLVKLFWFVLVLFEKWNTG